MSPQTYRVASIYNLDGTNRVDGRYPIRVGRLCRFTGGPYVGHCLYLEWLQNADGTPYFGYFRTSLVRQIELCSGGRLIVTTCNSVYTFEPIEG